MAAEEQVARRRVAAAAILLTLAVSAVYEVREGLLHWIERASLEPAPIEAFVEEALDRIPADARVRVEGPENPALHRDANVLSTRLHPRVLVAEGPADWVIVLPPGAFDPERASIRRATE